jgi:hypothetical protein
LSGFRLKEAGEAVGNRSIFGAVANKYIHCVTRRVRHDGFLSWVSSAFAHGGHRQSRIICLLLRRCYTSS